MELNSILVSELTVDQLTQVVTVWIMIYFAIREGLGLLRWVLKAADDELVRRSIAKVEAKE